MDVWAEPTASLQVWVGQERAQGRGVLISAASSASAVGSRPRVMQVKPGGADGRGRRRPRV